MLLATVAVGLADRTLIDRPVPLNSGCFRPLELVIPEGCAHGFQVLETGAELLYLHTAHYAPEAEAGIRFDDPRLGIGWPLPAAVVSERDLSFEALADSFRGIAVAEPA